MLERERLDSKKISKTNAVTSIMGHELPDEDVHVGPSDYVPWLTDRKWAHIRLEGKAFGDVPLTAELKLEVWDSPNSAGVVIDAVRIIKLALNNGIAGQLDGPSSYLMKSPHSQRPDDEAREQTEEFIAELRARQDARWPAPAKPTRRGEDRGLSRRSPPRAGSYAARVPAEPLSIAQVTPAPAGHREPGQRVRRPGLRGARAARARGRCVVGTGDPVKTAAGVDGRSTSSTSTSRSRRSVSSAALRHSFSLNVATFHAPQERVLSTQVARPLVEIFFGRLDARTVTTPATARAARALLPGPYELVEPGGRGTRLGRGRRRAGGDLPAPRWRGATTAPATRRLREPDRRAAADRGRPAHAHRPLARLRDPGRGAAARRPATAASGRSRSPTTTRSPGRWRRAGSPSEMGDIKVIVAEEVKTAEQGEVIGLFLEEKIPKGMTMAETIAEIRAPGRARLRAAPLRPLPLGARLRAPARHRRGDRHARGLQPAGGGDRLQRGGRALRPQVPDRPRRRLRQPRRPGAGQRAGADPRLRRARPSSSRRCGTPTSPASTRTWSTCRR